MEKKLMFLLTDSYGTYTNLCLDAEGIAHLIQTECEGVDEDETKDYEFSIRPVWMTQEEIDNLPEWE